MSRVEFMKFDSKFEFEIREFERIEFEKWIWVKFEIRFEIREFEGMNLREIEFRVVKFEIRNAEWMHGDGRKEKEKVKFETIEKTFFDHYS